MSFSIIHLSYIAVKSAAKPIAEIAVKYYVHKGIEAILSTQEPSGYYIRDEDHKEGIEEGYVFIFKN